MRSPLLVIAVGLQVLALGRRLSEQIPADPCTRWGAIALIACPELVEGDIRTACASCPGIVGYVQEACYAGFQGQLCTGDCNSIPNLFATCESTDCLTCWEDSESVNECAKCDASCFTHAHCWDPDTQTFSAPVSASQRETLIEDCSGLKRMYEINSCCSSKNGTLSSSSMYVRISDTNI